MNIDVLSLRMVKESTVKYDARTAISNPGAVGKLMKESFGLADCPEEQFYIICLDIKNYPVGIHLVSQGNLNSSIVHPREVFKRALLNNANSIILCHNHPSGVPTPSEEDLKITKRLAEIGELMGIKVMDHVVVGDYQFSFKEHGLI